MNNTYKYFNYDVDNEKIIDFSGILGTAICRRPGGFMVRVYIDIPEMYMNYATAFTICEAYKIVREVEESISKQENQLKWIIKILKWRQENLKKKKEGDQ